jgi:peptidoglycan/LPS O-acetylase OafA/YrhL
MAERPVARGTLAAAWLGGGAVFVAAALWEASEIAAQARYIRLGVVWMLFGVAALAAGSPSTRWVAARLDSNWSAVQSALLGFGVALVATGFVLSGTMLVALGVAGLLFVAVAVLVGV